jgi:glycosyltransferase involved in cell wall biosynthesis
MRIGIDARFLTHPQVGGFKTYTANLLRVLPAVDQRNSYVFYVDRPPELSLRYGPNVTVRVVPGTAPLVGMPLREQLSLARHASRDRLDLFHAPAATAPLQLPCPLIVTLHDMFWARPPAAGASVRRRLMDRYYQIVPRLAARRAARLLTISQAAKDTIVRALGVGPEQVQVTHLGFGLAFRALPQEVARAALGERLGAAGPFVLAIGSADPRKNLPALLAAYAALPAELRERFELLIVWTHQRLAAATAAEAERLGVGQRVRFLSGVSDEELALLYSAAELFAFPSLFEGFGLPPLEAMACGTPVVASNGSSLPEIAGDAALLVDTSDPACIAAALARLLGDRQLRETMRARGLCRAAGFSWLDCARSTVAAYEEVGSVHRRGERAYGRIAAS